MGELPPNFFGARATRTPTATSTPSATPTSPTATQTSTPAATPTRTQPPVPQKVSAVGDSVMLGAAGEIRRVVGNVEVDAQVSRQVSAGLSLLTAYRNSGRLGGMVVVQLGNNGTFTAAQFDAIMNVAGGRRVVFMTVKVPRAWEAPNNAVIRAGVSRHPNAVLADWKGASASHPEYFGSDGIHLTRSGAQAYARMIADAVGR
jgi:hypothetical protein